MHPRIHARAHPDHVASIMSDTDAIVRYERLEENANRGAHALRSLGLSSGDVVGLLCDNRAAFLEIYWTAQRAGLVLVPVSTRLKPDEIVYIVRNSGTRVLLVADTLVDTARAVFAMRDETPTLERIVSIGPSDDLPVWEDLIAAQPATPICDEAIGGRMVYSSGTTGRPKGIRYAPSAGDPVQPNPAAVLLNRVYGFDSETCYLSPAPLYHASPLGFTAAVQALGGTVVLMPKFDPEAFLAAIERYRVTALQAVPTMFIRLLKLPDEVRHRYDLSSLRTVIHAAAPCPEPVKRAMIEWLGPIVYELYAGSEGNGHVMISSEEWLRKPRSVGRAIVGEVRICSDEGDELPVGETGTIFFSGGGSFSYHDDPEKTAASRNPKHPGWSTMGDVGHLDADGYLFLADRKDFMIISGGVNIYPQEVEDLLVTHPAIADAAVFGVPHADFGEEVKAVVQPVDWSRAGDDFARELIDWCRERLADVKCPRSIDFERALPRAETGKLYKKELKARYWPAPA